MNKDVKNNTDINISKNTAPEVYLDFEGVISILKSRGRKVNLKYVANEIGYSTVGMMNLRKKAPKQIAMLHKFFKTQYVEI